METKCAIASVSSGLSCIMYKCIMLLRLPLCGVPTACMLARKKNTEAAEGSCVLVGGYRLTTASDAVTKRLRGKVKQCQTNRLNLKEL